MAVDNLEKGAFRKRGNLQNLKVVSLRASTLIFVLMANASEMHLKMPILMYVAKLEV